MRTTIFSIVLVLSSLAGCSSNTRQDMVPETFTVKNNSTTPIAILLFSGRTHGIGAMPSTISDSEFTQHQVNPGASRENVPVVDYIDGDSVYFQVYTDQGEVNGLVFSKLFNNIELIRNRKLLVYQSP